MFTDTCSHHDRKFYNIITWKRNPIFFSYHPLCCLKQPLIYFLMVFPVSDFLMNVILLRVVLCDWLLSFSVKCSRCIYVVVYISISFLFFFFSVTALFYLEDSRRVRERERERKKRVFHFFLWPNNIILYRNITLVVLLVDNLVSTFGYYE